MNRCKLVVAYDGTLYAGWQVQPNGRTVQGEIERAFQRFTGEAVKVHGSGRTDQGVHAAGQVAHCDLTAVVAPREILKKLNALLPADIRVLKVSRAPALFHARRSAVSKEYRYFIWNGDVRPPCIRAYRTHIRKPLDVAAMRTAAAHLIGRHDFAAFTANPNRFVESTVRTLSMLEVKRRGHEILVRTRSDGFLYKMVRSLVGLLIRVGEGAVPPSIAFEILQSRERTARVPTAPPEGLFLWQVFYGRSVAASGPDDMVAE